MGLRLVFMGTPDFAVPTLRALHHAGHDIAACYTQPPRPAGRRGLDPTPSPVEREARQLGVAVATPQSLKEQVEFDALASLDADVFVVVAYGQILPQSVLDLPRFGALNGHASLLPRWRGAAPIQRAIMAGDAETGVCIMKMEAGLDTGPVCLREPITISEKTTAGTLHDALADMTARLMVTALADLVAGDLTFTPQDQSGAVYAYKIEKAECRIDWQGEASAVHRHIMGLSPFPGAWCPITGAKGGGRLKILRSEPVNRTYGDPVGTLVTNDGVVACGQGAVRLLEVQKAGGKTTDFAAFLRGNPLETGTRLN